jgi:glycosyltransferase involved in cell wall biosynthesis
MTPTISVIVATYNRSEVLRWAVRSVRAQTFLNWELIVVGDACTDDTATLMGTFDDPRIRFVNLPQNAGEQSGPNNHGLELAHGELIAYLNHDDLWFPDHLATLRTRLEERRADLVYALPISMDAAGLVFCGIINSDLMYDPSHFVPASLWLARRDLIRDMGGWRMSRDTHASNPSQDLLFRAWRQGRTLCCSPLFTALLLPSGGGRCPMSSATTSSSGSCSKRWPIRSFASAC